jgi:hypothetical protein
MARARALAAALALAMVPVVALQAPAAADGETVVPATCTGIPLVGTLASDVTVNATDDVDPVVAGGTVRNTLTVPIPVGEVPISVTVTEVKLTVPIPSGVTVTGVTFTASSFPTQTWTATGGNLVATLTGSVPLGGSAPTPTVPDVQVTTTVAGPPRTVTWRVPSTITAKANAGIFGNFTATCTPNTPTQTLITTTVVNPNQAPTATDQTVPVAFETATPVTLSGTDPEGTPLTFAVATPPTSGDLSGAAPDLTYTPDPGFSGVDSFTFTASDGSLSDTGTVTLEVSELSTTVPGAPVIAGTTVWEGAADVSWSPPGTDGGSPITGYVVTPVVGGTPQAPVELPADARTHRDETLPNGTAVQFQVAARNEVGTGPAATSTAVTPRWWLPWSSGTVAVNELFTWLTGKAPTSAERTAWLNQLNAGTARPGDLVAALRAGTDATSNVDPTVRLYAAYLTRVPDASGLNFWLNRRRAGWTLSRISSNFAGSSEFVRRYGTLTNRQFVQQVYLNVLGRAGEASGIDFWTNRLNRGTTSRGQVMINFSESNEYKRKQVGKVHAAVLYIHVLGRTPSAVQRDQLAAALDAGDLTVADATRALLRDPGFANRAG